MLFDGTLHLGRSSSPYAKEPRITSRARAASYVGDPDKDKWARCSTREAGMARDILPLAISLATGLIAHHVFNRYEPRHPLSHLGLLAGFPLLAYCTLSWILGHRTPLAAGVVDHLVTLVLRTVVYRLSPHHPLAVYPGPLWCRITQLRILAVTAGGKRGQWLIALHAQYGSHVRIGEWPVRTPMGRF